MKGRKTLRRAGIFFAFVALLSAGMLASGALGMTLEGGTPPDTTSTATDATATDATTTDATTSDATTTDATTTGTTTDTTSSTTTTTATAAPTISSDKADYAPGSTVILTSSGWGFGERVHIFVNDDIGQAWKLDVDVFADLAGNFTYQFQLPSIFIADYSVTATGASGQIAKTSFTDATNANDGDGSMTVSPISAAAGSTGTFTFRFTSDPGKDFNSGSQVSLLVPASWTQPRITGPSTGRVTVTLPPGPTPPPCSAAGTPAISGSGPWTITVDITCAAKQQFILTYANATAPSPATTTTYSFDAKSKQNGGTLTVLTSGSPTVQVTVVGKSNQTISFTSVAPTSAVFGDQYTPAATATSGLPVAFDASGACSYDGGTGKVTMTSVGTCIVTADQAGNASFNPAPQVTQSFSVGKANQAVLTVDSPSSGTFGETLQIVSSGGSGTGAVSYSVGASAACALHSGDAAKLDITAGSGSCSVTATKAGDGNYNSITSAVRAVTVSKANQAALTVDSPDAGTFGDHLAMSASGGSTAGAISFAVTGDSDACSILTSGADAGKLAITAGSGTCKITATRAGNGNYNDVTSAAHTVTVSKANQTISVTTSAPASQVFDTSFTVAATASSGLAVSYDRSGVCSHVGATFTMTSGTGDCTVKYDQDGNDNYSAATQVTETVHAQKANQATLSVASPNSGTFGDKLVPTASGGSGGGDVSFTASGTACEMGTGGDAGKLLITHGTGTCSAFAHKAGTDNYYDADSAAHPVSIAKKTLTVTAPTLTILLGTPVPTLSPIYVNSQFVGSDTSASLNTQPTCATTTAVSGIGTYVTRCSGGSDNNYDFTYVDGTLRVNYNFHGFFQPVDNDMFNAAQAGSAIPVKFDLNGDQGLNIFAAGYPKVTTITCPSASTPVDAIEETVAASTSGLQYGSGQYIYVWKTDKSWANSCRQLEVKFADGMSKFVKVQFKK
jgi:hypothetical protein